MFLVRHLLCIPKFYFRGRSHSLFKLTTYAIYKSLHGQVLLLTVNENIAIVEGPLLILKLAGSSH